jgi:SAM-dependent methyltransferase
VALVQKGVEGGKTKTAAPDVNVLRCADCDLDFLDTWDEVDRAHDFYAHDDYVYVPDIDDGAPARGYDEYQLYFDSVAPYLGPDTRVLDVGCGDGRFLNMVRPHARRVVGTELTPALVGRLRLEGIEVWDRPIEEIASDETFDIVCLHAVLEHVPRVQAFLQDLRRFLHPESQLFITVPHGLDPLTSFYDVESYRRFFYREYHFYYFTERSLCRLLSRAGYRAECRCSLMASITNHFHWLH